MAMLIVVTALLGSAIGSFVNVVVHRVPAGLSVVSPGSRCPACGHAIRVRHNLPVVGWMILRGRCADCGSPISVRYPLVELGTGVLFMVVTWRLDRVGGLPAVPAYLFLGAVGVALTLIDASCHRLPDSIVLPSYPVFLLLLAGASWTDGDWPALLRAGAGGIVLLAVYAVVWFVRPGGMGFGDVKLAGLLGIGLGYLSWSALVVGGFAAFVLGGVVGAGLLLMTRRGRKAAIAFGPFMVAGVWVAFLAAQPITAAYLRLSRSA